MSAASLPEDQKIFSMKELKEKGFSQYKVSKLVDEGMLIIGLLLHRGLCPERRNLPAQCCCLLSLDNIHS